jgi:transposase
VVVAPSLIPIRPGARIKTDRRDARKLAELLRGRLLTEVHAPTAEQEAVRDLCPAREASKEDQKRVRHRLPKLLLRRGIRYTMGRKAWAQAHQKWLRGLRLDHAADQAILDDQLLALEQIEGRLAALDTKTETGAQAPALCRARGLADPTSRVRVDPSISNQGWKARRVGSVFDSRATSGSR